MEIIKELYVIKDNNKFVLICAVETKNINSQ